MMLLAIFVCLSAIPSGDTGSGFLGRSDERRPNILWIIAENVGPDLGCYGAPLVRTPYLDQLAKEGVRYEQAFATSPVCSPSRSALMTGMYQTAIGAHNHRSHRIDFFPLPEGVRPLTHRLQEPGTTRPIFDLSPDTR